MGPFSPNRKHPQETRLDASIPSGPFAGWNGRYVIVRTAECDGEFTAEISPITIYFEGTPTVHNPKPKIAAFDIDCNRDHFWEGKVVHGDTISLLELLEYVKVNITNSHLAETIEELKAIARSHNFDILKLRKNK